MFKIILLFFLTAQFFWSCFLHHLKRMQLGLPVPENVRDVYDAEKYRKFCAYTKERGRLSLISGALLFLLMFVLILTDGFAAVSALLPAGEYGASFWFILVLTVFLTLLSLPFDCYDTFHIEEKYGFNKSTGKTFLLDSVKSFLLTLILSEGITMLCIFFYGCMGKYFIAAVFAVFVFFTVLVSAYGMTFLKIFHKFTPLPEGTLREDLTKIFTGSGYGLKEIYVMNASLRTTRSNAFCTGMGKYREIVLYDNLVKNYTEGEILGVFSHELSHFRHRDARKAALLQTLAYIPFVLILYRMVADPGLMASLGFSGLPLPFGAILFLASSVLMNPVMTLCNIPFCAFSRRFEYRADADSARAGYGPELISVLKKLSGNDFADVNPHPFIVRTTYSHPALSDRICAIEEYIPENRKKGFLVSLITEADFGCEERPEGAPLLIRMELTDGERNCVMEAPDDLLKKYGIREGDRIPEEKLIYRFGRYWEEAQKRMKMQEKNRKAT